MATFKVVVPEEHVGSVHQSLLSFNGVNMLIDLGWDADLSMNLDYLMEMAPSIDVILLTHATASHIGAYANLSKFPEFSSIPVFATLPVINMGRMVTLDMYRSVGKLGPFPDADITVQQVEQAFDKIESLKYSQPFNLSGKLEGITITAYNAGHTLGGTIWKIQKDHEDIVYAVDWNHSKDSHLNGAFMNQGNIVDALSKPSVMICGTKTGQGVALAKRRQQLFENIQETLSNSGTVLIPTSSGARVLELVHVLDKYWTEQHVKAPLVYLSHVGKRTMSYASSMLEWMNGSIISEWESQNNSPFDTKNLKIVSDMNDLRVMDGPKVVIASGEALEAGMSKLEFTQLCGNDNCMVILTEKSDSVQSLGNKLYNLWETEGKSLTTRLALRYPEEEPLEGEELAQYNSKIKELKSNNEKEQAMEMRIKNILEQQQEEEEESDSDDEELLNKVDLEVLLVSGTYDYDVRNKGKSMFPYSLKRKRNDDYGEVIRVEDFMKSNDKQVVDGSGAGGNNAETKIGEKRQWSDYDQETHRLDVMWDKTTGAKMTMKGDEFKVLCKVDFIDFEGLTDERSLAMVIDAVDPKRLIMIGDAVRPEVSAETVVAESNQTINASINSFAYSVKVSSDLEGLLKWQRILDDYQVAHVVGRLKGVVQRDEHKIESVQDENDEKSDGQMQGIEQDQPQETHQEHKVDNKQEIELVPSDYFLGPVGNQLYVGDIKLAELKRKLISQGHRAEYRAEGILVCDDKVAIRKIDEGKVVIEGGVDPEFYETKNVVRQLLARV